MERKKIKNTLEDWNDLLWRMKNLTYNTISNSLVGGDNISMIDSKSKQGACIIILGPCKNGRQDKEDRKRITPLTSDWSSEALPDSWQCCWYYIIICNSADNKSNSGRWRIQSCSHLFIVNTYYIIIIITSIFCF